MKALFLSGLALAIAAGIALPLAGAAEAAIGGALPSTEILPVENAQFFFAGQNYCWYDDRLAGPRLVLVRLCLELWPRLGRRRRLARLAPRVARPAPRDHDHGLRREGRATSAARPCRLHARWRSITSVSHVTASHISHCQSRQPCQSRRSAVQRRGKQETLSAARVSPALPRRLLSRSGGADGIDNTKARSPPYRDGTMRREFMRASRGAHEGAPVFRSRRQSGVRGPPGSRRVCP